MLRSYPILPGIAIRLSHRRRELGAAVVAEVDEVWREEQRNRTGALFDGSVFSLVGHSDSEITGEFVEYRWLVAQRRRPALARHLRARPLGVSGLVSVADGILFGRRAADVTWSPGLWELVPSGSIDKDAFVADGTVDYRAQFLRELEEETGIEPTHVVSATAMVLIQDLDDDAFDLGLVAEVSLTAEDVESRFRASEREYSELRVVARDRLQTFAESQRDSMLPVSVELARNQGLIL